MIGEQPVLGVIEGRLGLDGAGGGVDGVVERIHAALGQQHLLVTIPQLHGQVLALRQTLRKRAHMGFRQREQRIDGPDLGNRDDAGGIARVHHVAQIRQTQTQSPGNRRGHTGVAQLQLGGIDLRLVGRHRAFILAHQRGLGVDLLVGDRVLRLQILVALQVELGVLEQRLIALQRPLHLIQRRLKTARIDLGQQLPCLDLVAFLEMQLDQLARHLGAHHGSGAGIHRADSAHQHAHVALVDDTRRDGLYLRATAWAARAAGTSGPAPSASPLGARGLRLGGGVARLFALIPPIPAACGDGDDHHAPNQTGSSTTMRKVHPGRGRTGGSRASGHVSLG